MAARQGFDLFNKYGRRLILRTICFRSFLNVFDKQFWKYLWTDTFCQMWCWIVGHREKRHEDGAASSCTRCWHFLPSNRVPAPADEDDE